MSGRAQVKSMSSENDSSFIEEQTVDPFLQAAVEEARQGLAEGGIPIGSMSVLHRVAEYFDVAAWVEFVPFSALMRRTRDLSPKALMPLPYDQEFDRSKSHPQL